MLHTSSREVVLRALLSHPTRRADLGWLTGLTVVSKAQVAKELKALTSGGYLHPTTKQLQKKEDLLEFYALGWSTTNIKRVSFEAVERPTFWIKKLKEIASDHDLEYVLTGLSACEIIAPVTQPKVVEAFVPPESMDLWREALEEEGAYPSLSTTGSRIRLFSMNRFDIGAFEVLGNQIASLPLVYAHLVSQGGRNREAASVLLKEWDV